MKKCGWSILLIGLSNRPSHEVDIFPSSRLLCSEKTFVYGEHILTLFDDCYNKPRRLVQLCWGTGMQRIRISIELFPEGVG